MRWGNLGVTAVSPQSCRLRHNQGGSCGVASNRYIYPTCSIAALTFPPSYTPLSKPHTLSSRRFTMFKGNNNQYGNEKHHDHHHNNHQGWHPGPQQQYANNHGQYQSQPQMVYVQPHDRMDRGGGGATAGTCGCLAGCLAAMFCCPCFLCC